MKGNKLKYQLQKRNQWLKRKVGPTAEGEESARWENGMMRNIYYARAWAHMCPRLIFEEDHESTRTSRCHVWILIRLIFNIDVHTTYKMPTNVYISKTRQRWTPVGFYQTNELFIFFKFSPYEPRPVSRPKAESTARNYFIDVRAILGPFLSTDCMPNKVVRNSLSPISCPAMAYAKS